MAFNFRHLSLGIALLGFWLILSGHYTSFLIGVGVVCCIGIVVLAEYMSVADEEGHPVELAPRALTYWPWLACEIAKSAWGVSKLIIDPALPISPTMVRVVPRQKTSVGVNVYANSITLTPGTISVEVSRQEILVHAITAENAEEVAEGAMDRRVCRFEGSK